MLACRENGTHTTKACFTCGHQHGLRPTQANIGSVLVLGIFGQHAQRHTRVESTVYAQAYNFDKPGHAGPAVAGYDSRTTGFSGAESTYPPGAVKRCISHYRVKSLNNKRCRILINLRDHGGAVRNLGSGRPNHRLQFGSAVPVEAVECAKITGLAIVYIHSANKIISMELLLRSFCGKVRRSASASEPTLARSHQVQVPYSLFNLMTDSLVCSHCVVTV